MYCGEVCLAKGDAHRKVAQTLPCRRYSCDECGPVCRRRLIATAHSGLPNTFITLTSKRQPGACRHQAARDLSRAARVMIKRANRENARDRERSPMPRGAAPAGGWPTTTTGSYDRMVRFEGKGLAYFIVFEETKLGWPHLHVLCRTEWFDTDWLSAQMADLIGSPVVKVKRIADATKVAGYVAKYVGKSAHAFEGCKRWWMTPSYRVLERDERPIVFDAPGKWERVDTTLDGWIAAQRSEGMWAWKVADRRAFALRPG